MPLPSFVFGNYETPDLYSCGQAFADDFRSLPDDITSKHILRWFAAAAPENVNVFGSSLTRNTSEFMLDQCHTTFPRRQGIENGAERWDRALAGSLGMKLALESEWGSKASHNTNYARILDDAWKVAVVKANSKVMIFASSNEDRRNRIVSAIERLRTACNDDAPWLWIDIPWSQKWITPRKISFDVLP